MIKTTYDITARESVQVCRIKLESQPARGVVHALPKHSGYYQYVSALRKIRQAAYPVHLSLRNTVFDILFESVELRLGNTVVLQALSVNKVERFGERKRKGVKSSEIAKAGRREKLYHSP